MANVDKNEIVLEEPNLLSDRKIEVIIGIARYLEEHREVRKSYLRDITGGRAKTFEDALAFLESLSLISIKSRYPPDRKNKQAQIEESKNNKDGKEES